MKNLSTQWQAKKENQKLLSMYDKNLLTYK